MMMKVMVKQVKHLPSAIRSNSRKKNIRFSIHRSFNFRKSDIEKSTEYLTKYLEKVANKEGDVQYARACSALGFIHNTLVRHCFHANPSSSLQSNFLGPL